MFASKFRHDRGSYHNVYIAVARHNRHQIINYNTSHPDRIHLLHQNHCFDAAKTRRKDGCQSRACLRQEDSSYQRNSIACAKVYTAAGRTARSQQCSLQYSIAQFDNHRARSPSTRRTNRSSCDERCDSSATHETAPIDAWSTSENRQEASTESGEQRCLGCFEGAYGRRSQSHKSWSRTTACAAESIATS